MHPRQNRQRRSLYQHRNKDTMRTMPLHPHLPAHPPPAHPAPGTNPAEKMVMKTSETTKKANTEDKKEKPYNRKTIPTQEDY